MRTRVAELLVLSSNMRVQPLPGYGGSGVNAERVQDPLGAVARSPKRLESELTWIEDTQVASHCRSLLPPKYIGAEQGGTDT